MVYSNLTTNQLRLNPLAIAIVSAGRDEDDPKENRRIITKGFEIKKKEKIKVHWFDTPNKRKSLARSPTTRVHQESCAQPPFFGTYLDIIPQT